MKVEVYRNLRYRNKVVYSIRDARTKIVLTHSERVVLREVEFRVSAKGNARVRREKVKNVHAVVRGTLLDMGKLYGRRMVNVKYNPYEDVTFIEQVGLSPIYTAKYATLDAQGCWAHL